MKKLLVIALAILLPFSASAASIIRDAEIENVLRNIANPIFDAAGLSHDSINIYIVNDPQINAYVAGGSNIFINTGLLGISENPSMLAGVIAHETGHIAGGHLLLSAENYKATTLKATLGYMVGLAAAAAGSPQAGVAIAHGAGHIAEREMLKYSRSNEEAADQSALTYMDKTHRSSIGLLELLDLLYSKESEMYGQMDPYVLTHPLSKERISHIRNHIASSEYKKSVIPPTEMKSFQRSIIKLNAFLLPYEKTLAKYPVRDNSINAYYARAIAYYKVPNISKSLAELNDLLHLEPENPFFNELKGQVLFENGHVTESVKYYQKAVDLLPDSPLLKIILSTSQIATDDKDLIKNAILNIKQALLTEQQNSFAWHQLAIAYGKTGDLGLSNLSLAEEEFVAGNKRNVKKFLNIAKKHLKKDSPADIRSNDLLSAIERDKDKKD